MELDTRTVPWKYHLESLSGKVRSSFSESQRAELIELLIQTDQLGSNVAVVARPSPLGSESGW